MLASGRGKDWNQLIYISAFIIPAAVFWGVLGILLQPLGGFAFVVTVVATVYAFGYGVIELFGIPFRTPDSRWQVPASWLAGRSPIAQTIIWGVSLGPGLVTRNPYAGIWLLLFLITLSQNLLVAILVGIAHGAARAIGILHNRKYCGINDQVMLVMGAQIRWRFIDGLALILFAGILSGHVIWMMNN